ncbi:MAG: hypothetical protein AAF568_03335, partial [Pseudomonadota bacterium]
MHHLIDRPEAIADQARLLREIDRIATDDELTKAQRRQRVVALLSETYQSARARIRAHLLATPHAGLRIARSYTHATDAVVTGA